MVKILVVEDEPSIADNIRIALESENFTITTAPTGTAALKSFRHEEFDFLILDVGLPDQSGFDLCKIIRQESDVPLLFLTARDDEIDRVVGLEIGADDYVTKPFSPRELVARVKVILKRSQKSNSSQPTHSKPFEIDDMKKSIRFQDECLELSRYEYKLLKHLVEHPGQVFSRDQLMEAVWDDPGASLDRTVDAHIKSLRQKLKEVAVEADWIITHRGLGYSLKDHS